MEFSPQRSDGKTIPISTAVLPHRLLWKLATGG
jgi:hypothetical protein